MKVLKGFKALEYILNNKDKKLYNRRRNSMMKIVQVWGEFYYESVWYDSKRRKDSSR